jgi:hypothetical protein
LIDSSGNIYNGDQTAVVEKYDSSGTLINADLLNSSGSFLSFGLALGSIPAPASVPFISEWTQIALAFMSFGLVFWYQRRESV